MQVSDTQHEYMIECTEIAKLWLQYFTVGTGERDSEDWRATLRFKLQDCNCDGDIRCKCFSLTAAKTAALHSNRQWFMLTARVITLDGCQWQHNYANIFFIFFITNNWGKGKGTAGRCESSCWLRVWLTVSEWVSLLAGKDVKALGEVNILHSSSALRVDARKQPIASWWHIREGGCNVNYCCKDQQPSVGTWTHPSVHKAESSWRKVKRHSLHVTLQIPFWKKKHWFIHPEITNLIPESNQNLQINWTAT